MHGIGQLSIERGHGQGRAHAAGHGGYHHGGHRVINLLVDLSYGYFNPRVRLARDDHDRPAGLPAGGRRRLAQRRSSASAVAAPRPCRWRRFARNRVALVGPVFLVVEILVGRVRAADRAVRPQRAGPCPPASRAPAASTGWAPTVRARRPEPADLRGPGVAGGAAVAVAGRPVASAWSSWACSPAMSDAGIDAGRLPGDGRPHEHPGADPGHHRRGRARPGPDQRHDRGRDRQRPRFFRIARAQTQVVSAEMFVEAARTIGVRHRRILWRHVMPNMLVADHRAARRWPWAPPSPPRPASASSASACSPPRPVGGRCCREASTSMTRAPIAGDRPRRDHRPHGAGLHAGRRRPARRPRRRARTSDRGPRRGATCGRRLEATYHAAGDSPASVLEVDRPRRGVPPGRAG